MVKCYENNQDRSCICDDKVVSLCVNAGGSHIPQIHNINLVRSQTHYSYGLVVENMTSFILSLLGLCLHEIDKDLFSPYVKRGNEIMIEDP